MSFKVQVGPAQIAIHQGQTVLLTEPSGHINWPSKGGLYFRDTRVISAWAIYANGELWDLLNGGAVAPHAARIFQTNRAFVTQDGPIEARTLGLIIGGHIGSASTKTSTSSTIAGSRFASILRSRCAPISPTFSM